MGYVAKNVHFDCIRLDKDGLKHGSTKEAVFVRHVGSKPGEPIQETNISINSTYSTSS